MEALQSLRPIPLEQLLFLAHDNLHGADDASSLGTGLAYAQSWAFVHYLIFGQRDVPAGSLMDYVQRLRTAVHPDEAFRLAFGGTYAEIDQKLKAYLHGGRYYVARQPVVPLSPLKAEPADGVDVESALGRLRMAGRHNNEARGHINRAIAAAPDDPRGYELQGELAEETGDPVAAQIAYRAAIQKGSRDFRPYYGLAFAEHAAASEADGSLCNLSPETARAIANGYERAINLNPRLLPAFQGLAGLIELLVPENPQDVLFLELGLKLYPHDGMVRLGVAAAAKRDGQDARASDLLNGVLNGSTAHPPQVMGYARQLEAAWLQRDVFGQVDALANENKYREALTLVDERLAVGVDFSTRQRLQELRAGLQGAQLAQQGQTAWAEQRWDDARASFNAVLQSNASPRSSAQRSARAPGATGRFPGSSGRRPLRGGLSLFTVTGNSDRDRITAAHGDVSACVTIAPGAGEISR